MAMPSPWFSAISSAVRSSWLARDGRVAAQALQQADPVGTAEALALGAQLLDAALDVFGGQALAAAAWRGSGRGWRTGRRLGSGP